MFTGIIADKGVVLKINDGFFTIKTNLDLSLLKLGDSISIDGACHSIIKLGKHEFEVFSSIETFDKTIVKNYKINDIVNLELPMLANSFIGGHNVSGHVDCVAPVFNVKKDKDGILLQIKISNEFIKYIIHKGSVTINGISLTVNEVNNDIISLYIIPITIEKTNIALVKINDFVNIEVDAMAKYIEKLINNFQK
jgi:riboflavin synthase